jgi:hypothetical protein
VRNEIIATGNIHNPDTGLKALCNNPSLHVVRPPAVPAPGLNHITSPNKTLPTIRHQKPLSANANLLAGESGIRNASNQWDGNGAYCEGGLV